MTSPIRPVVNPAAAAIIGVARRDVTPPAGIYNRAWGAARHDVAEGIHRPMTATAISIRARDGGEPGSDRPLVLVAVDAGWWQLNDDEMYVRGAVLERFGLDPARVMIAFAHTHAGPSLCRADADKPGGHLVAGYLQAFRDAILDAVDESLRTARPATLAWAYGRCGLATNRDLPDPDKPRVVCGYNPAHAADDTLLVGRITEDATGRVMGTIANYACHPTTLAWDNKLISPDYVGALHEIVETHTGGAPCAFLQGASGELSPAEQYVGDTGIADRNGRWLGYAVLATLESMLPPRTALCYAGVIESGAPLAVWERKPREPPAAVDARLFAVPLPLKPLAGEAEIEREAAACADRVMAERLRRKLRVRQSVGTGETCVTQAWCWRVGDALLVGQPNEAYSAFQVALRRAFPDRAVAVMNLVNGCVGYLSPAPLHDLDIYQVWQSPFDRPALDVLVDACARSLNEMIA
jgi:hypothetical protein